MTRLLTRRIFDLPERASLTEAVERAAAQEAVRHARIDSIIGSTTLL